MLLTVENIDVDRGLEVLGVIVGGEYARVRAYSVGIISGNNGIRRMERGGSQ